MTSGVPQGTVLGPYSAYYNYINDSPDGLQSRLADDALLYGIIASDVDCNNLQDDLFKLEQWQSQWQMEFNPQKCQIICISTNNKKDPPQRTYASCGVTLEQVESIPYLGVTLNNKLKWSQHISSISNKASKFLGMVKRNPLWNCPLTVRETAYTALVRPKLEYECKTWDPYYKKDKAILERIQRKAARFCTQNYQQTASVTDILKELNWDTLETRRKKARLTRMYKLSHNLININAESHLIPHPETRTRGSHPRKYFIPRASKDIFKFSFFPRTINESQLSVYV